MEDHSTRLEVAEAFEKGMSWSLRPSDTLGGEMMYVAVAVEENEKRIAVVRTAIAVTAINQALRDIYSKIFLAGLAVAVAARALS